MFGNSICTLPTQGLVWLCNGVSAVACLPHTTFPGVCVERGFNIYAAFLYWKIQNYIAIVICLHERIYNSVCFSLVHAIRS